jgi:membrane protein implicated in regulation of membrane protease activity
MRHHLVTLAALFAALILYALGLYSGASILFAAGGVSELVFWARVLRRRPCQQQAAPPA